MTQLLPRFTEPSVPRLIGRPNKCESKKVRYRTEADAVAALIEVRKKRVRDADPHDPENHLYPCTRCEGWHLSSTEVFRRTNSFPENLTRNGTNESWEDYAHRLEFRIKEQRGQLMSIQALGHGSNNRASRQRIQSLVIALGHMTELWEKERRNRQAVVARLAELERGRRWFRWFA